MRQAHAVVDFRDLQKASGHRKNNMAGLGGNLADGGVQLPGRARFQQIAVDSQAEQRE